MDQPAESPDRVNVTIERQKATQDVTAVIVTNWTDLDGRPKLASYVCPECHRRTTGSKTKPHLHSCGTWIVIGKREG